MKKKNNSRKKSLKDEFNSRYDADEERISGVEENPEKNHPECSRVKEIM